MARPLRINYPGAFYHVTCRGNERKNIFADDRDRSMFLDKGKISLGIYQVRIHAYVLMNNHFHMIVETQRATFPSSCGISISATPRPTTGGITVSGIFYQGRFKAILVDADNYLLELSRYVHLNPVRLASYKGRAVLEKIKDIEP